MATAPSVRDTVTDMQRLLDEAARTDEREGVRQGDLDIAQGRTRPAADVIAGLRKQYDLPR